MARPTLLAWYVTCAACGHHELRHVNDGGCDTAATAVLACCRCLAEWTFALQMRPVEAFTPPPSQHRATPSDDLDRLVEATAALVDRGASITAACRQTGISTKTYRRRLPGARNKEHTAA